MSWNHSTEYKLPSFQATPGGQGSGMFEKVYDTSERCFFEPCISSPHRPLPACLIVIASRSVLVP